MNIGFVALEGLKSAELKVSNAINRISRGSYEIEDIIDLKTGEKEYKTMAQLIKVDKEIADSILNMLD
ncbi:MAG: hypothetical protein NZT61_00945 [Deltaproteobacteria bacterium]|nr:hypothetical protein [Deltaproteobacteria bacterium]